MSIYIWTNDGPIPLGEGILQENGRETWLENGNYIDFEVPTPPVPTFTGLCFTAEEANSVVQLNQNGAPTAVNLEISTDGITWTDYTIGNTITLANVGDKVYMRNKSETDTGFSIDGANKYKFVMGGKISSSGDVTSLMNKNGTTTLPDWCFVGLFFQCASLTTAPSLPATTLANYCYCEMFEGCTSLINLPELPATTLTSGCYEHMFLGCTSIKLSKTQTGEYQILYRIPTTGTGTDTPTALRLMFSGTGGTFTGTPTINTTYYLSNGVTPPPTLLSYEELLALGDRGLNPLVTELNKYPDDYYNKLKSEGHLTEWHTDTRYIKSQSYRPVSVEGYGVGYNSGSWAALII